MISDVFNMDCLEYMRNIPDKFFDIAIADPPYGIKVTKMTLGNGKRKIYRGKEEWDNTAPSNDFFEQLLRISKKTIIWGANHFISKIPFDSSGWIVWDKGTGDNSFADCELAWSNFEKPVRKFFRSWVGANAKERNESRIHPTQKPVSLYCWILKNYAIGGGKIFDPMMGSQSSRIAAYKMGFDFWGCELDEEYFKLGCERFEKECKGIVNVDGIMVEQKTLF